MYFLMIESSLGDHLLSLKDFTVTSRASLSITILALNIVWIKGESPGLVRTEEGEERYLDEGGVPGHHVLPRPIDLLAADVAVDVSVRTDSKDVNAEYYSH